MNKSPPRDIFFSGLCDVQRTNKPQVAEKSQGQPPNPLTSMWRYSSCLFVSMNAVIASVVAVGFV
jgi:hypothetical protein